MTEVIAKRGWFPQRLVVFCICIYLLAGEYAGAQTPQPASATSSAEQLYLELGRVVIDGRRVYEIRNAPLDYDRVHINLDHGTIGFSSDVYGQVTGAFFEGEGEVLVIPPDQAERASMSLFTGAAILEDGFETGYLRFNDNTFEALKPYLRPAQDAEGFVTRWADSARNLAAWDALRLFMSYSRCLPAGRTGSAPAKCSVAANDRFLHARIQSPKLGVYDLTYDGNSGEPVSIGQPKIEGDISYYNVWASFPAEKTQVRSKKAATEELAIRSYAIDALVRPPTELQATAVAMMEIRSSGARALAFELSRFLKVKEITLHGQALEFIQNQALEGTQLARRGNDVMVVVFPEELQAGQTIELKFVYAGDVLSEAGGGLLYVGARGIWYPNRGMAATKFDLRFRYPAGWTLLATGRRVSTTESENAVTSSDLASHWISETAIPVAGFNLGKYFRAEARSNEVVIETYAAAGVERSFPKPPPQEVMTAPRVPTPLPRTVEPAPMVALPLSPAKNAQTVANTAASAVSFYSARFGSYPYDELRLTQMPGPLSQGWPGLIFLSSYSFLTPEDKTHLTRDPVDAILAGLVTAHETAHQWWGDLVYWRGYRDQWFFEGLANYCSLVILETQNRNAFQRVMSRYRENLLEKNKRGAVLKDAGPVSLGLRLSSSEFPNGYEAISYGRGTWLFHMLRHMLDDGQAEKEASSSESHFMRALRKLRDRYAGKPVTTREALQIFADELPSSVKYEGEEKLEWFNEGWINGTAIPHFELQGVKLSVKDHSVIATGSILQKDAPRELVTSVPLYARMAGNRRVFITRIFADGAESAFRVSAPAGTLGLLIDPEQTVLKN